MASNASASPSISTAGSPWAAGRRPSATSKPVRPKPSSSSAADTASARRPAAAARRLDRRRPRSGHLGQQRGVLGQTPLALAVEPAQSRGLAGHRLAVGDDGGLVVAVAALEVVDRGQPLLEPGDRRPGRGRGRRRATRTSAATSSSSPSRPAQARRPGARSADRTGPARRSLVGGARRSARAPPSPPPRRASWIAATAPGDRLGVTPGAEPGADLVGLADPQAGGRDLAGFVLGQLDPTDQLARDRRPARPAPPGSARQRSTAPATALASHPASRRRHRAGRAGHASSSSRCWSCWPWTSTSPPTVSASRAAVTGSSSSAGGRPAAGADLADDDQRLRHPVEQRLDPGRRRAVADEPRVGARAEGQPERVDEQALAGARLAGDDVEPGAELEPQPVDQREVGDGQLEQSTGRGVAHDGSSSTLRRSRSQNGIAPAGSTNRIGREPGATPRRRRRLRPAGPRARRC